MTPVQQLIQDFLYGWRQFSVSMHQAGASGTAKPLTEPKPSTSPAPPAEEKSADAGETRPPSTTKSSPDWSEDVTEPGNEIVASNTPGNVVAVGKAYDLAESELVYQEFLMRRERHRADGQWIEDYQDQLDRISGGAESFTLNGREVLTYRRNGNLSVKKLEAEHPDKVAQYTRLVTELKFDKAAFEAEEPELFKEYRAKVFRVTPKATRIS